MEVLTIDDVIEKIEYVKNIDNLEDKNIYLNNLLSSIRISTQSLGLTYSFILESIKTLISTINNIDCVLNYSDVSDFIGEVLRILKSIIRDSR